jgi:hypothetical protein
VTNDERLNARFTSGGKRELKMDGRGDIVIYVAERAVAALIVFAFAAGVFLGAAFGAERPDYTPEPRGDLIERGAAIDAIEQIGKTTGRRLWSDDSPWNQDRSKQPIAANSQQYSDLLDKEGPFTSDVGQYTLAIEHPPASTPLQAVRVTGNVSVINAVDSTVYRSGAGKGSFQAPTLPSMSPVAGDDRWVSIRWRGIVFDLYQFGFDEQGRPYANSAMWSVADGYGAAAKGSKDFIATNGAGFPLGCRSGRAVGVGAGPHRPHDIVRLQVGWPRLLLAGD